MGQTTGQKPQMGSGVGGGSPGAGKPGQSSTATSPNTRVPGFTLPGGPSLDPNLLSPVGPMERSLAGLYGQQAPLVGPASNALFSMMSGGSPQGAFLTQLGSGMVPQVLLDQLRNEMGTAQAGMLERMGGQRFGSDAAGAVTREQGRAITNLGSNAIGMGLQANQLQSGIGQQLIGNAMNTGGTMLNSELMRSNAGMNLLNQQWQQAAGLPPELAGLLGLGGGGTILQSGSGGPANGLIGLLTGGMKSV